MNSVVGLQRRDRPRVDFGKNKAASGTQKTEGRVSFLVRVCDVSGYDCVIPPAYQLTPVS